MHVLCAVSDGSVFGVFLYVRGRLGRVDAFGVCRQVRAGLDSVEVE